MDQKQFLMKTLRNRIISYLVCFLIILVALTFVIIISSQMMGDFSNMTFALIPMYVIFGLISLFFIWAFVSSLLDIPTIKRDEIPEITGEVVGYRSVRHGRAYSSFPMIKDAATGNVSMIRVAGTVHGGKYTIYRLKHSKIAAIKKAHKLDDFE